MQGPFPGHGAPMPPTGSTIPLGEEAPSRPAGGVYAQNYAPQQPQRPQAGVYAMDGGPHTNGAGVYAINQVPAVPPPPHRPVPTGGVYSTGLPQAPSPHGATGLYAPNSAYDARHAPQPAPAPQVDPLRGPHSGSMVPSTGINVGYPVTPEQGDYRY